MTSLRAALVRDGGIPEGYPEQWPAPDREVLPPNTSPFSLSIADAIAKRKADIKKKLADSASTRYPRDEVREVLEFWKISL